MKTADSFSAEVAAEIRAVMGRRGVRQSQLARMLGTTDVWLSVRLRGVQAIDLNDLWRIADALDVPVVDFMPPSATSTQTDGAIRGRMPNVTKSLSDHSSDAYGDRPATRHDHARPTVHRPPSGPGRTARIYAA